MHPAKVAGLIEAVDAVQRLGVWQQVDASQEARILEHLDPELARLLRLNPAMRRSSLRYTTPVRAERGDADPGCAQGPGTGQVKRVSKILWGHAPGQGGRTAPSPCRRRSAATPGAWSRPIVRAKVLSYLHDESCSRWPARWITEDLVAAVQRLDLDDLVDLIQSLPEERGRKAVQATGGRRREKLESMLSCTRRIRPVA